MNKFLQTCLLLLAFATVANAQSITVNGKVTAKEDAGILQGVTVKVKGTNTATLTNIKGEFSIILPSPNATLVFTYVGYTSKEITPGSTPGTLNVVLEEDARQLGEVVITTALGIKRKAKELGYATQTVSAKDLTTSRPTNLAQGLSGKVAGLQINQANNQIDAGDQIRVVLRGDRSFVGNNQALLVVDGVTTNLSYLNSINPNDVESVNVLKGANAAALYGSEASNGVIIVTTKKGQGDSGSVTFTNTTMLNKLSYFPKLQNQFGGGTNSDAFGFPEYTPYENQNYGDRYDGSLRPLGRTLPDGTIQMATYQDRANEKKNFFNTGLDEQNDVTYAGGDAKGSVFINAQRLDSKGTDPGDKMDRTSFRINGVKNYNNFSLNYSLDYSQRNYDKSYNQVYNNVINTPSEIPLTKYSDLNSLYGDPNNYYNDYYQSPYFGLQDQRQTERKDALLGNIALNYKATDWLNFTVRGGISSFYITGKYTQAAFNYSDFAKASGKSIAQSNVTASESDYDSNGTRYNGDFLATFEHKILKDFNLKFIAGAQYTDKNSHAMGVSASNLVISDLFNVSNVSGVPGASESVSGDRQLGLFGDLTIGYKDYLFLHASGRRDEDSRLNPSNRKFFYPAVDASFVFTDAIEALKDKNILSSGKIRAGISKVYAVQIGDYSLQSTFGVGGGFPYGTVAGFTVGDAVYDPNLKPEQTVSKEIGLDLGFLHNRITLETSYYFETTKDQEIVTGVNTSNATGFSNAVINTGSGQNQGIEVTIAAAPVITVGGFAWNLTLNYSHNENKATSLYQGLPNLSIGNSNYIVVGESYPRLLGNDYNRDPKGRVIVNPVTGLPTINNALVDFGQTNPKNIYSVTSSFTYKHFTLSGTAELRTGAVFYNGIGSTLDFAGVSYTSAESGRQRFVYPNSVLETSPGVFVQNTNITTNNGSGGFWADGIRDNVMSNYVVSADFLKIRELALTYDFPKTWLSSTGFIKKASFGLVGRNLFMFRPKSNIYTDPEINVGTDNAQGVNNLNQTPPTRIYGFTLSAGF